MIKTLLQPKSYRYFLCVFTVYRENPLGQHARIPKDYMQNEIDNYLILIHLHAPVFE